MSTLFDSQTIDIPCPHCGKKTRKTIAWAKANRQLTCSHCGSVIAVDNKGLLKGLESADKALADFKRKVGKLGK